MKYIAHVKKDEKTGQWLEHDLNDHLQGVAKKASEFAQIFGSGDWAHLAGLWHDLGKFLPDWQKYIRTKTGYDEDAHVEGYGGRPNHSTAGAILAMERLKNHPAARILAYIIAGHHAGLPDWYHQSEVGGALQSRLYENSIDVDKQLDIRELNQIRSQSEVQKYFSAPLPKSVPLAIKDPAEMENEREHFHLWIRMLFSCLVDADFLDTEAFMNPSHAVQRGKYSSIQELADKFDHYMNGKQSKLGKNADNLINIQRQKILEQCRKKAGLPPGFFTLTVPTGGGKTLSSMAFALRHALKYGKQRIIVAIPYTSIIEQTAKVYKYGTDDDEAIKRSIENGEVLFGEEAVLEHHSNIDPEKESNKSRLASENWDAPIIVTTNVQLLESLFASRTSSCRKLHNIVNSVIILDEAQILPPEYFKPALSVLRGLVKHFGVTVVLCTATQPAFCGKIGHGQTVFEGLTEVIDIIENLQDLDRSFKRVEIVSPDLNQFMDWVQVADNLKEHKQALCIVNTRQDCRDLHALMPTGTVHLSANMCGEERSERISFIKQKLKAGEEIRVISTQLVEAGVDIDFPVVYRALAGIDSIAQAAGRCNREGKLNEQGRLGKVIIFQPPKPAPVGLLRKGEDTAKSIFRIKNTQEFNSALYSEYFRQFYASVNDFDKPRFSERLVKESGEFKFQFRTFAQEVRLIDDTSQQGIIVWYQGKEKNSLELIDYLRRDMGLNGGLQGNYSGLLLMFTSSYSMVCLGKGIWKMSMAIGSRRVQGFINRGLVYCRIAQNGTENYLSFKRYLKGVAMAKPFFDKIFCLEVWGDYACFTRPEMKVERVSYDVITPSASRAIFESIFWKPAIRWQVKKIEVLKPIKWISVRRNEVAAVISDRSDGIFIEESRQQRAGLFLKDVKYRLYADLIFIPIGKRNKTYNPLPEYLIDKEEQAEFDRDTKDENPGKYNAMFERRARKGQCFNRPYLGCREFSCMFRLVDDPGKEVVNPINETRELGFMLYDMDFSNVEDIKPAFFKVKIENGVITVPAWDSEEVKR